MLTGGHPLSDCRSDEHRVCFPPAVWPSTPPPRCLSACCFVFSLHANTVAWLVISKKPMKVGTCKHSGVNLFTNIFSSLWDIFPDSAFWIFIQKYLALSPHSMKLLGSNPAYSLSVWSMHVIPARGFLPQSKDTHGVRLTAIGVIVRANGRPAIDWQRDTGAPYPSPYDSWVGSSHPTTLNHIGERKWIDGWMLLRNTGIIISWSTVPPLLHNTVSLIHLTLLLLEI